MPFKVSYLYKQAGDYDGGWSENFWTRADDAEAAMAKAELLMPKLMAVHGTKTRLIGIRIGPVAGGRRVASKKFNDPQNSMAVSAQSDIPTTRLQLILHKDATYQTLQWLGGIPDSVVVGGVYTPDGNFSGAMTALCNALKLPSNLWGLRVLDAGNQYKDIENLTNTGIVTVTGHGYATGNKVLVSRTFGIDDANGTWKIKVLSADSFQLLNWGEPHGGADALSNGRVKRQNFVLTENITAAEPGLATKHNVGRPSRVFTGKRRRR